MTERRNRPSGASPRKAPSRLIKGERPTDTTVLWRVGTWGGLAVLTLLAAIFVARSPIAARSGALGDANSVIIAQAKQLQHLIQQNDSETRRLAAALGTLNSDRDRLYQRVTELERNLETVTGSITRLAAKPPATAVAATPPPVVSAPQSIPVAIKLAPIPPEPFPPPNDYVFVAQAPKAEVTASIAPKAVVTAPPAAKAASLPAIPDKPKPVAAAKTPLGIDLGSANSIEGLRAIWDSTRKAHAAAVEDLQPVITIQEPKNGLGLQLRLVAGPLPDAASAEKRCAALIEAARPCASAAYDGQRLASRDASAKPVAAPAPKPPKAARSEPKAAATPPKPQRSFLPSILGGGD